MCGILAILGSHEVSAARRARVLELSRRLRHRGPDWSGLFVGEGCGCYLAHERLAVIDPASGDQPLFNESKEIVVSVNGEIYNHVALKAGMNQHKYKTQSDCEVIAHLYEEIGEDVVNKLDGMFSFVLVDQRDGSYIAARDPIGITPLYLGWGLDGSVWFASEMKALKDDCERFETFPPGHIYSSKEGGLRRYYNPPWFKEIIPAKPYIPLTLRHAFEKAVIKRLMTDVPFGVLLSGGLDSSLVAAVASRHLADSKATKPWGNQLHSFCVGLKDGVKLHMSLLIARPQEAESILDLRYLLKAEGFYFHDGSPWLQGSPDLKAAREVANYLGTLHSEFHFTVQEGLDALADVIYYIETYDVTTIRASTPMFLMSRKIKALGVKMVLSGEGSDEIFGGYLYFHKAPSKEELHRETCRKLKALHLYDCLRANKATSAWGLEARVPFLDKDFIDIAMAIDPAEKMVRPKEGRIEKWILRKAFDDEEKPYLPKPILYRQKEQFSDGVGYSWIDGLKAHAASHVTDKMLANAKHVYPHNTPGTKEAYLYRMIFEKCFPQQSARLTVPGGPSVACSTAAAIAWDKAWSTNLDPSGRAATGVHDAAYKNETHAEGVKDLVSGREDTFIKKKFDGKGQDAIELA